MKKFFGLLVFVVIITISGLAITASANTLGESVYSDIVVYINNQPIKSYYFNGQMLIVAEDLYDFGFDVTWDDYTKTIRISKNPYKKTITYSAMVFKPTYNAIGLKQIDITTTPVKVYSGNSRFTSYGGIDGYTLINVEDMACMDNVYTTWNEYSRSLNVWVTEGLEKYELPLEVRELNPFMGYNYGCNLSQDVYYDVEEYYSSYSDTLFLSFAQYDEYGTYCICPEVEINITDVIDANGRSRKKPYTYAVASTYLPADEWGYYWGITDYMLTSTVIIVPEDLTPHTAYERYGWIEYEWWCPCLGWLEDSLYVECLPYSDPQF